MPRSVEPIVREIAQQWALASSGSKTSEDTILSLVGTTGWQTVVNVAINDIRKVIADSEVLSNSLSSFGGAGLGVKILIGLGAELTFDYIDYKTKEKISTANKVLNAKLDKTLSDLLANHYDMNHLFELSRAAPMLLMNQVHDDGVATEKRHYNENENTSKKRRVTISPVEDENHDVEPDSAHKPSLNF